MPDTPAIRSMMTAPGDPVGAWERPRDPDDGYGKIQWKGTEICMDVTLPCGCCPHIDGGFAYFIRCDCGHVYQTGTYVAFRKVTPAELEAWRIHDAVIREDKEEW